MDEHKLALLVQAIARETFGRDFNGTVRFNHRFKTRAGDINLKTGEMRIAASLYDTFGPDILSGVIKHELCHWFLFCDRKPYSHRSAEFRKLLQQTGALRFAPGPARKKGKARYLRFYFACSECQTRYVANYPMTCRCPGCRRGTLIPAGTRRTHKPLAAR